MVGWGYAKENGPATWPTEFPIAAGAKQSPIDIKFQSCKSDDKLKPITATYKDIKVSSVENTGHSWKVQVNGGVSSLKDGPLSNEFVLEQFHCHWGRSNATGSEHTVNGQSYPAELHLVHWNKDKFKTFGEAAVTEGGLAVLGMFLKIGKEHEEMNKITKLLPYVQHKGQTISVLEAINPGTFIPADGSYWTYGGSLTTPPCYESVNWIVYEIPIEVSEAQLGAFRAMKSYHPCEACPKDELKGCMVENYRPVCPLNERVVKIFKDAPKG